MSTGGIYPAPTLRVIVGAAYMPPVPLREKNRNSRILCLVNNLYVFQQGSFAPAGATRGFPIAPGPFGRMLMRDITQFIIRKNKKCSSGQLCGFQKLHREVPPGFEPGSEGFADLCLTTWLWHRIFCQGSLWSSPAVWSAALRQRRARRDVCPLKRKWSGRRGSDSRPPPWQGGALPTELLPHVVPWGGIEPPTRRFSVCCSTD